MNIALARGHNTATVRAGRATFHIADILIIGVITDDAIQYVEPTVQFSLLKIDERQA